MEITTIQNFKKTKNVLADEFIVITDHQTGDIIHIAFCDSVKEKDFRLKMIENKGQHGKYYHFKRYEDAKRAIPTIFICKNCAKHLRGRK